MALRFFGVCGLFGLHVDVKPQFLFEIVIQLPLAPDRTKPLDQPVHVVSITRAIASATRFQLLVSFCSCFRPSAVRR